MKDTTPALRTFAFTPATSRRVARALTIAVAACVVVLLSVRAGLAAEAKFVSLGQGIFDVAGEITGPPKVPIPAGYAGTLNVDIGPPFDGPIIPAYCIDIAKLIHIGDVEPEVPPTYSCQVVYILNKFYPNAASVLAIEREAAAVQAAIWFFTDDFVATAPSDVVSRASDIIAAANIAAGDPSNCASVVPQSITVTPADAVNFFPDYSHTVTATLIGSDGQPLANYPVTIEVTGVSGNQTFSGITSDAGELTVTYTNAPPGTAGTDTITATASFNSLLGLQFEKLDTQPIVLAGKPNAGMVQGTANKTWKVLQNYHCYETHRQPRGTPVSLVDEFGPSTGHLAHGKRFCAPADTNDKDSTAPLDPDHLTSYELDQDTPRFRRIRDVGVVNQFGTFSVDLIRPDALMVPTGKSLIAPLEDYTPAIDHFKCYGVRGRFRKPGVKISDQFGTITADIKRPVRLCAPVNKNGEGIIDPVAHLLCYQVRSAAGPPPTSDIFTLNQFGKDQFPLFGTRELCVPSLVTLP